MRYNVHYKRLVLFTGPVIDVVPYIFQYFRSDKLRGIRHLGELKLTQANIPLNPVFFPAEYWRSSIMSSMVALEATEPRKADQSQFDLANILFVSDCFCDGGSNGGVACGDRLWSSHDFVIHSSLLCFYFVEKQTNVVFKGDVQCYNISATIARCGG